MEQDFDMKGEILFEDGLKVHFKCYRGQRTNTIKYHDLDGEQIIFETILGKPYKYLKLTSVDGTRYEFDNFIGIWEKLH